VGLRDVEIVEVIFATITLIMYGSTRYVVEDDRIIIRRGGYVVMDIPFSDIDLIEYVVNKLGFTFHERMYRLALPKAKVLRLKIKRKGGLRYLLINPRDPDHVIKAWYLARYPAEAQAQGWQSALDVQPGKSN
jgi:hypothetical protein